MPPAEKNSPNFQPFRCRGPSIAAAFQLCNSSIVDCRCFHSEIHPAHCSPAGSPQFQLRNPSIVRGLPRTSASMACFHLAIQPTPRRLYIRHSNLPSQPRPGTSIAVASTWLSRRLLAGGTATCSSSAIPASSGRTSIAAASTRRSIRLTDPHRLYHQLYLHRSISAIPASPGNFHCRRFRLAIQPTPCRLYSYLLQLCNSSIRGTTISPTSSPRPGASSRRTPPLPPLLSPPSHSGVGGWAMKAGVNGVNGLENRGRQSGRKRRKTRNGGGYSSVQVGNEVNRIKTESKSKSNKKKRKPGVTWAQRRGR